MPPVDRVGAIVIGRGLIFDGKQLVAFDVDQNGVATDHVALREDWQDYADDHNYYGGLCGACYSGWFGTPSNSCSLGPTVCRCNNLVARCGAKTDRYTAWPMTMTAAIERKEDARRLLELESAHTSMGVRPSESVRPRM